MPRRNNRSGRWRSRGIYMLVLHYVDEMGSTVAEDYRRVVFDGEDVAVGSPRVVGMRPSIKTFRTVVRSDSIKKTIKYYKGNDKN